MNILIAGATGSVGRELVSLAKASGHRVTALARNAAKLQEIADRVIPFDATQGIPELSGNDVVISALGAPIAMGHKDRRPFRAVDFAGNLNILKGAKRAGVQRFVYVSVHVETGYAATSYVLAHEEFGNALQSSGLDNTIVRPTGIFSAFDDFIPMARRGTMMVLGDGSARSNPIHPTDVAQACLDCIVKGPAELNIGGPDILTRRQIAELAFEAVGKKQRILRMPASVMDFGAYVTRIVNPRLGELLEFLSRVATVDCVAPAKGKLHLADYFKALQDTSS
jgi:uncharacterized protein YbjT (DUF2867 family)